MNELRRNLRQKRVRLSSTDQLSASQAIFRLFLEAGEKFGLNHAQKIAFYAAFDGEIDPVFIIKWCWACHKTVYLPVLPKNGKELMFCLYTEDSLLSPNPYHILEPRYKTQAAEQIICAPELDLICLPLTGFDRLGNRLGMGQGFYDSSLRNIKNKPFLLGLAHHFQEVELIKPHSGDVKLNGILTDKNIFIF